MSYNPTSCPAPLRQHRCKKRNRTQRSATIGSIAQSAARATQLRARTCNTTQRTGRFLSPRATNRSPCDLAHRIPRNFLGGKTNNRGEGKNGQSHTTRSRDTPRCATSRLLLVSSRCDRGLSTPWLSHQGSMAGLPRSEPAVPGVLHVILPAGSKTWPRFKRARGCARSPYEVRRQR
jgi:hypothetical protein